MSTATEYYVPHAAKWPIVGSIGLATFFYGFANMLNGYSIGKPFFIAGIVIMVIMMIGWFGDVIRESESGMYSGQVDTSFRMGMMWFIFSEVMFFAAFFGALFYARTFAGPWLAGDGGGGAPMTNVILWDGFGYSWPNNGPAGIGGDYVPMGWFGLPLLNTLILLASGVTVTIAHHAIQAGDRKKMVRWLLATVALGFLPSKGYTIGESFDKTQEQWPKVIQYLDYPRMADVLGASVIEGVVQLDNPIGTAYPKLWKPVAFGPEKHIGYALQWFAVALTLLMVKDDPNISSSTHGELIHPAVPLEPFVLEEVSAGQFNEESLTGVWSMLTVSDGPCDEVCQKNLYHMRQVRLSVAQNMDRVQRVILIENNDDLPEEVRLQHEGLRIVSGSTEQLSFLLDQIKRAESELPLVSQAIYLIDPNGNLMMRFANDQDPKGMLKDLKHLLKVSRIG
ncbi:unnamed protein product [Cyprideis torosa]|uniref:Multifunctional fusion protein n=1 Tax=Cyprideis torosa TaxID=163714 RepID=A0A7R8VZM9_9CRUS|nr:unnamed protein product [Cyprideis torosa]CAG0878777.1 unnamed protein product [Cyprideis torosa]